MNRDRFRRIALSLGGAIEKAHMGHPDFRAANGRIFATLNASGTSGAVKLTPEQQARALADHAHAFAPAAGAWGRSGWTTVTLAAVDEESAGEALTLAWQNVQSAAPHRRAAARRRTPSRR